MEQLAVEKKLWESYFDSFNKRHHSRLARLQVNDETGSHQTVKKMPLNGVVFDDSGIEIMLANGRLEEGNHYTHIVENPKKVIKDLSLNGMEEILVIVDEAGYTTTLSFENLPELEA